MSYTISVNPHPVQMGKNPNQHKKWTDFIREKLTHIITDVDLKEIDFFNFDGRFQNLISTSEGARLVVLGNASFKGGEEQVTSPIQRISNFESQFLSPSGFGVAIEYEGKIVAEYIQDSNELNILFDLFAEFTEERGEVLVEIFQQLNEKVFKAKAARFSWKYTNNKPALIGTVSSAIRQGKEKSLREDKEKIKQWEGELEQYRLSMKQTFDKLFQRRNSIELEEKNLVNIESVIMSELDMIAAHPKVKDIQVKNGKYIVYTSPIYAYDEKGRRYYIGNCWFEIDMSQANVKFFNDNPRQGYWSNKDMHPHVDETGRACLGNASATIAELSSQQQIYALTMVCIDYLESVNIQDGAGAKVRNWDKVDEEGKIIARGGSYKLDDDDDSSDVECPGCEEDVSHLVTVFERFEITADGNGHLTYTPQGEHQRCEECRTNLYTYHNDAEEYIRD